jgi:hypothetical protein
MTRKSLPGWVDGLLILAVGLAMSIWSWGTWPDVLIDFGRELYVPWRITEGDALYRDLSYFNGPLSPYLNAGFFRLFGTQFLTLVLCNLALLGAVTGLLYHMVRDIADRLAATSACIAFLSLFAFSQYVGIGNYNFIAPYSHEATHGSLLALGSLALLWRFERSRSFWMLGAAGFALGLVFLTKAELFIAALGADLGFLFLLIWGELRSGQRPKRLAPELALFFGCVLTPVLLSVGALALTVSLSEAIEATSGAWANLGNAKLTSLPFYRSGMGLDEPLANFLKMLEGSAWYALLVAPALAIGLWRQDSARPRWIASLGWALLVATGVLLRWNQIVWTSTFRALPLAIAILLIATAYAGLRAGASTEQRSWANRCFSFGLLSLLLLAKMILNARIFNYGFFLAMPATLFLLAALVSWLPRAMESRGGSGNALRVLTLTVLTLTIGAHLGIANKHFAERTHEVGTDGDRFRADPRGKLSTKMLEHIETHLEPEQTLAVFPEGIMLNYLSRRASSVPFINFMPPELLMFGEDNILRALEASPPDFVALVHKDTSEYGATFFGRHYGQAIMAWIVQNYRPIERVGALPLRDRRFGMLLLERKP